MSLILLDSPTTDPAINLSVEEILMHRKNDDYIFFYINAPSVIIGKHQNTFREVNLSYTENNGIPVLRRLSGGGTVFHDEGNLNFSFILNGKAGKMVDFGRYMEPVVRYIQSLGIEVEKDKRHNLRISGLKISGNAEHIFKQRVLHHGTLLFSSRLDILHHCLEPAAGRYTDKAISSERSRVTNISGYLKEKMDIHQFRDGLIQYCIKYFQTDNLAGNAIFSMPDAGTLAETKYRSWDWNWSYSPDFRVEQSGFLRQTKVTMGIEVKKGRIHNISLEGKGDEDFTYLCQIMNNLRYNKEDVRMALFGPAGEKVTPALKNQWLDLLFPET